MENEQNEPGMVRPWLLIVLAIVVLAGIGFFSWNYWQIKKTNTNIVSTNSTIVTPAPDTAIVVPTSSPSVSTSPISTADWKMYTDKYFSISYPDKRWQQTSRPNDNYGPAQIEVFNIEPVMNDNTAPKIGVYVLKPADAKLADPSNYNEQKQVLDLWMKQGGSGYQEIVINGQKMLLRDSISQTQAGQWAFMRTVYAFSGSTRYTIEWSAWAKTKIDVENSRDKYSDDFQGILSTFQFTK